MTNNFFELVPGLWIGNVKSANDYNLFKKNNIKCTINCENDFRFLLNNANIPSITKIVCESISLVLLVLVWVL